MDFDACQIEAQKLRRELTEHSYRYYVLDDPVIDDETYDMMLRRLIDIETRYPELVTEDSPTRPLIRLPPRFPCVVWTMPLMIRISWIFMPGV